jgi:hypothetical protein
MQLSPVSAVIENIYTAFLQLLAEEVIQYISCLLVLSSQYAEIYLIIRGSTNPLGTYCSNQLQKWIHSIWSGSLSSYTSIVFCGQNLISLLAVNADCNKTSVSCAEHLNGLWGLVSDCARMLDICLVQPYSQWPIRSWCPVSHDK